VLLNDRLRGRAAILISIRREVKTQMERNEATNKAVVEVIHNIGPANTTTWDANVRANYEAQRQYQEQLKKQGN
jgi:hypothetical protein